MNISFSACKQAHPRLNFTPSRVNMDSINPRRRKDKVVFVMGATGTGKSKLSIDLATRFFPAEIINSDKMQVYEGLDIVTNKVTEEEKRGIPHHLLGVVDPYSDFTAFDFTYSASRCVEYIVGRNRIPIIVGGSNSFIEALVEDENFEFRSKYDCCFLWVHVSLPVLDKFVSDRVDRMVESGLVDEVRSLFDPANSDYSHGIRRAIGMPEMDLYLRNEVTADEETLAELLEEAVNEIKANTRKLARRQLKKIHRLQSLWGSNVHCLDATDVFLSREGEADEAWERSVRGPGSMIVGQFLYDNEERSPTIAAAWSPDLLKQKLDHFSVALHFNHPFQFLKTSKYPFCPLLFEMDG